MVQRRWLAAGGTVTLVTGDQVTYTPVRGKAPVVSVRAGEASGGKDLLSAAADRLSQQHGTLFVVAAGNSKPGRSVNAPDAAITALTVGSVTKQSVMSEFSSRAAAFRLLADLPSVKATPNAKDPSASSPEAY